MRRTALGALAYVALAGAGCLTFDRQQIVLVFPPGTQEVRGLAVFEGLRVQGTKGADLDRAKADLKTLSVDQGAFYAFGPLPLKLEVPGEAGEDRALALLLRKHLVLQPGAFFEDKGGRLNYYHTFTVRDRGKFVAGVNAWASGRALAWATEELKAAEGNKEGAVDLATLKMVRDAASAGHPWLVVEPGRLSVSLVGSPLAVRNAKADFLSGEHAGAWLRENPVSFVERKGGYTVSVGVGEGEPIRVGSPAGEKPALRKIDQDLVAHARGLKVRRNDGLTAKGLIAEFLASGVPERGP